MKWITRQGAKVDRIACPWLIKRFIDPHAEFLFVPAARVLEESRHESAIPFDIEGAELSHKDGRCSFETIIAKYGLMSAGLNRLARIVHAADIDGDLYITPEGAGLLAVSEGLALTCRDDHKRLEIMFPIYEALFAYCEKLETKQG